MKKQTMSPLQKVDFSVYTLPNPTNSTNSLLRTTFRGTLNDKIRFANGAVARSGTADHVWHLKLYLVNHEPEEVIVLLN